MGGTEAACLSSSWGGPQIMGFNHAALGYSSATELANAFSADERWHVLGFADFCRDKKLINDMQTQDWTNFGKIYNGDGAVYGPKIKAAYDLKSKLLKLPRVPTIGPTTSGLSTALFLSDPKIEVETSLDAIE
ncbi:N-acetylmuramidase domain-containing protein [Pararhizobium gei]|uniref:N-acetylmuramidase domain-containing protein n=1 Tax=Pararhizobium gei TaxID=1395951 RepID=UPI003D9C6E76